MFAPYTTALANYETILQNCNYCLSSWLNEWAGDVTDLYFFWLNLVALAISQEHEDWTWGFGNVQKSDTLTDVISEHGGVRDCQSSWKILIQNHLTALNEDFESYLPDLRKLNAKLVRNSFSI